jgi:hypothetical protein
MTSSVRGEDALLLGCVPPAESNTASAVFAEAQTRAKPFPSKPFDGRTDWAARPELSRGRDRHR